jgi:hypothetical protein
VTRGAPPVRGGARRLGAVCATALVLLLPTLVATRHAADPARSDELARIARAFGVDDRGLDTALTRGWCRAVAGTGSLPAEPEARQAIVVRARVRQLGCVLLTTLCLFGAMLAARGRIAALFACLAFAALPAVAADGAWLRPEGPAAVAGAFAFLLFQQVADQPRTQAWLSRRAQRALVAGLAACGLAAQAVAIALLPTQGAVLLLPGAALLVLSAQIVLRSRRLLRRGGWLRLPIRAINARLLPWTALSLLAPAVALAALARALRGPAEAVLPTAADHGLLPGGALGAALLGCVALGGLSWIVGVGARFRRHGRASADLLLFLACALAFGAWLRAPAGVDLLPLALPTAIVAGEGAYVALLLGRRAFGAGSARALTAP